MQLHAAAPSSRGRPLADAEREHLRKLDALVPRYGYTSDYTGDYPAPKARDASSPQYGRMRAYVAALLREGVAAGSISCELTLSIVHVRNWRREADV